MDDIKTSIPTWSTVIPAGTTHLWEGNPYKKLGSRIFRWCDGWVLSQIEFYIVSNPREFVNITNIKAGRQTPRRLRAGRRKK